jgi:hypothetical protein
MVERKEMISHLNISPSDLLWGVRFLSYLMGVVVLIVIYWSFSFGDQEEIPTTFAEVALYSLWYALLYYKIAQHTEGSIDNGNRSAYHPMVDTITKKKSEACVRER